MCPGNYTLYQTLFLPLDTDRARNSRHYSGRFSVVVVLGTRLNFITLRLYEYSLYAYLTPASQRIPTYTGALSNLLTRAICTKTAPNFWFKYLPQNEALSFQNQLLASQTSHKSAGIQKRLKQCMLETVFPSSLCERVENSVCLQAVDNVDF